MCATCTKAKKLSRTEALALIGAAIAKGKDPEHFMKVLDVILETVVEERDEELDAAWEECYRPKT